MNIHGIQSVGTLTQISGAFATLTGSFTGSFVGDGSGLINLPITPFDSSSLVTTASFNAYTSSTNQRVSSLESNSASVNTSITQLNASSASQQISIDALNTNSASVNTSISALNTFTASQSTASIVTSIDNLNTFSASALVSISNINNTTASLNTSVSNLNTFTASAEVSITNLNASSASQQISIDSLNSKTGSYATTGSNTFTGPNTFTSISASSFVSASTFVGDGSRLTNITSSIALPILDEGIPQGNAFSMNFTGSGIGATVIGGIAIVSVYAPDSASFNALTASYNSFTASTNADLNAIHQATASLQQFTQSFSTSSLVSTSSFNAYTASNDQRVTSLETNSASVNISITNVNSATASLFTSVNNLNSATSSLFGSASLALTTASFDNGTRNLTFTKGDNQTFSVNIPDVSGSAEFVTTASFNAYTASNDQKVNSLISATGSYATTGSNVFVGNQTISGSLFVSGSEVLTGTLSASALRVENNTYLDGQLRVTNDAQFDTHILVQGAQPHLKLRDTSGGGFSSGYDIRIDTGSFEIYDNTHNRDVLSDFFDSASASHTTSLTSEIIVISGSTSVTLIGNVSASIISASTINGLGDPLVFSTSVDSRLDSLEGVSGSFTTTASFNSYTASNDQKVDSLITATGSYATTGSNTFTGDQTINNTSGNSNLALLNSTQNAITLEAPNNYLFSSKGPLWIGNYGAFGGSGSVNITATSNSINLGADNGVILGRTFGGNPDGSGAVKMNTISGSLVLAPSGFNVNPTDLLHLSSSSNTTFVNLIFKNNTGTADTIISGSNNIFTNPSAPAPGFKRYIGGANNIINTFNSPQISGSMAISPNLTGNYIGGTAQLNMRGPVSSSAWTISNNIINAAIAIGSTAANNAEKVVAGMTLSNNMFNNSLSVTANRSLLTQTLSISNNNFAAGPTVLTPASSSIIYTSNLGGGIAVTNAASGGLVAFTANAISIQNNVFGGASNTITATGSQDPSDTGGGSYLRHFDQNQIFGTQNGVNLPYAETGSNSLNATMIAGYSLGVTGSNASSFTTVPVKNGSAFFGRYNAQDGNKAQSAQTVFAVGTGDSTTRKTGFLIDSGSNTFIEGTLNVSGSTTLSGSLYIQSASAFPSQIGTSLVTWNSATGQVGQATTATLISSSFSAGEFFSTTTLSGSAGVSASIELPNTAISNGVSIQNNSQITVQNTGVYNIQFSAQADAFDGADTIWIWFKKNGTNITDSASKLIMQNNTAAIMTVNIFDNAVPNDYFEVVWQNNAGSGKIISDAATGNIPRIPSVIVTVNQVK
jgi:uncharacterized coiled-coil protein SlyX